MLVEHFLSRASQLPQHSLWPKAGGFTLVIMPNLVDMDDQDEQVPPPIPASVDDLLKALDHYPLEDIVPDGMSTIIDECPFDTEHPNVTEATQLEFRAYLDEEIGTAHGARLKTEEMVRVIEASTLPKIVVRVNFKDGLSFANMSCLESPIADQIKSIAGTAEELMDATVILIPSRELVAEATEAGLEVRPQYLQVGCNIDGDETFATEMAENIFLEIQEAFLPHVSDVLKGVEWMNNAKVIYQYQSGVTTQEHDAQRSLEF